MTKQPQFPLEIEDSTYYNYYLPLEELQNNHQLDLDEYDSFEKIREVLQWEERPYFLEGVVKRLNELEIECTIEDSDIILAAVRKLFKEKIGQPLYNFKAIETWVKGEKIPSRSGQRINHYTLCYALGMNLEETATFFYKHYLTIPFNYKDRVDAVFCYCIHNNRPYEVIKRMLETAKKCTPKSTSETKTNEIGRQIFELEEDAELEMYFSEHCYSDEQLYQSARSEIVYLIEKHSRARSKYNKDTKIGLYRQIMGFAYKDRTVIEKVKQSRVLPEEIRECFPTENTFSDICNGKKESYETMRKTLVILKLYDYYKGSDNDMATLDDFCVELDDCLVRCGFSPLYAKHPFDGMILYCVASEQPLENFQMIANELFADE